jgi:hypothetical protein
VLSEVAVRAPNDSSHDVSMAISLGLAAVILRLWSFDIKGRQAAIKLSLATPYVTINLGYYVYFDANQQSWWSF